MPQLRGPQGAIGYQRDDLGYPSIDASSLEDASWARGWFHAYDRLVQVQLMLAIARGRALALIGDAPLARYIDRMTRLHRFTDDLDAQVAQLSPEVRRIIDAYGAGFDAGAHARGWPLLLRALGIPPAPFRPHDLILIYRLVTWFGLNQIVEMAALITGELVATGAPPQALALLLGDAASADELATAPRASWPADLSAFAGAGTGGSNAIAIAGKRSASGGALLAADPHMEIARIPPVLYATHATHGGGAYMQGLHVPGLWIASFGRTDRVGWAYTYGRVASVDVRVVRCRRGEVFDGAAWRPLVRRTARVKVKKKRAPETWTFWDCELGTIVGDAHADSELALPCVQWSGVRETHRDADVGLALVRAPDVDAAIEAHRGFSTFCFDAVLADSSGRIGHVITGRMDAGGRVVPHSPDGRPIARHDEATRPVTIDPPSGWLVSANARPIEAAAAVWVPMADTPARLNRLAHLVGSIDRARLADLARFVIDACDAGAERLLAAWAPHLPDHPRARRLVEWARAQPGDGDDHFSQLALWNVLHSHACRTLLRRHLGSRADHLIGEVAGLQLFRHHLDEALALERPQHLDAATLRDVLAEAFPRALADAGSARLPRRDRFKNAVLGGKLRWLFDSRPIANRGGPTTPNQVTALQLGDQVSVFGAAGRFLCDMSRPGGWYCMPGGASERRLGVGYGEGLEDWARGRFRPLGDASGAPPSL
jgi:penicillin amidase